MAKDTYQENMFMKSIPLEPHFYIVKLGFSGICRALRKFEDIIQKNTKHLIKHLDVIIYCYFNFEIMTFKVE